MSVIDVDDSYFNYSSYEFQYGLGYFAEGVKDAYYIGYLEQKISNSEIIGEGDDKTSVEEIGKISHILVLLHELGLIKYLNKQYVSNGLKNELSFAKLIGTIINKTSASNIETIRKTISAFGKRDDKNPINERSLLKIKNILENIGIDYEKILSSKKEN